ncbi:heptaprenyl diphosphate synthase component 1 [Paenibacillus sp. CMAA1364]
MKSYRIPQLASSYIEYDMIDQNTNLPKFAEARVYLLYIFLNRSTRVSDEYIELYTLVTSLIQMGLDTHEMIDTDPGAQAERDMRSRQLKVLAGDYYSSRFYQLLSDQGQIEVITQLSQAICQLNMMKMSLYSAIPLHGVTPEQYLERKVQLNMQLFLSFTPMMDDSLVDTWRTLLQEFSLCETVINELQAATTPYVSNEILMNVLCEAVIRLQQMKETMIMDELAKDIGHILEPIESFLNNARTVAGKG